MPDKAYIIKIATYNKGKLTEEGGFLPYCYKSKWMVARTVRRKAKEIFESISSKLKPNIQVSYNDDYVFKGKVRVYFKDGYVEIKPFELDIVEDEINGD